MAITYPTTLDTLTNPAATDKEDNSSVYHDVQHSDVNDAVEALEAKVGVNSSTVTSSLDYRIRNLEYPAATGGEDDDFNDGSFSGWSSVGAEAITATESLGRASLLHPGGGTTAKFSAYVKSHTFATNDWCEVAMRTSGINQSHNMVGICHSNGTVQGTSNAIHWLWRTNNATWRRQSNNGFNADTANAEYGIPQYGQGGEMFLRLRYEGSNTFRGYVSCDGVTWIDLTGAVSYTLSPTHWGMSITTWGGTAKCLASYAYFRTGNG